MNKKSHIKIGNKILLSLIIMFLFNLFCLYLWGNKYVVPEMNNYIENEKIISKEILNKEYSSNDELIEYLTNKNVNYKISDLNNNILYETNISDNDYPFFSEIITVGNNKLFIKGYLVRNVNTSKIMVKLLRIEIIVQFIVLIILGFVSRKVLVRPIEKVINDIKNYKYGRKPIRNKVKTEIDVIQNEFVSLTEELDSQAIDKNRIIASISHDIKTPLTSIIGYSDLIKRERDKKTILEYNTKINRKALDIKEITNNFDDYLINDSENNIKLEKIKIYELVELLENDYKEELKINGIDFKIKSNCNKEELELNIPKIKRVFSNLISNSVRYLKDSGFINIDISKQKKLINFKVYDNGIGTEEKFIDKIFEPLYTTDESRKISGLGLSIVKEIILFHKGDIKAYNNSFGGLTIEFNLPLKEI